MGFKNHATKHLTAIRDDSKIHTKEDFNKEKKD